MSEKRQRIVLLTGASRGLGFAIGAALAGPDAHIYAVARTVGGLEDLDDRIKEANGHATLVPLDVTDEDGLRRMCRAIHDRDGRIDLLIHAAADAAPLSPAAHVAEKDYDRAMAVNARAAFRLLSLTEPLLKASQDPRAIFFDDPMSGKFTGAYGASKAALRAYVQAAQAENERIGPDIRFPVPRPMSTALRARFFPGEDRDALARPSDEAARLLSQILPQTDDATQE